MEKNLLGGYSKKEKRGIDEDRAKMRNQDEII